jgi:hypothetical protein
MDKRKKKKKFWRGGGDEGGEGTVDQPNLEKRKLRFLIGY